MSAKITLNTRLLLILTTKKAPEGANRRTFRVRISMKKIKKADRFIKNPSAVH